MKRFLLFAIAACGMLTAWADIPSGKTIYLDASQHWCCHKSYYIFFSRDSKSHKMAPVPGNDGVYSYTTTSSTQDNVRFCWSDSETAATVNNQVGTHTKDVSGWSASKPYYVLTQEGGNDSAPGEWRASASVAGTTALGEVNAALFYNCATENYVAEVVVNFDGAPCGLKIEGDKMSEPFVKKKPQSPYVYHLDDVALTAGQSCSFTVSLYSDVACTSLIEKQTYTATAPQADCSRVQKLTVCLGEPVTLSSSVNADAYLWDLTATQQTTRSVVVSSDIPDFYTYVVRAYKMIVTPDKNLMENGDFESPTGLVSDYQYAGQFNASSQHDYYEKPGALQNGIYALCANAQKFWRDYAPIKPHGGQYFALFDAAQQGYAWKATIPAILKDSTYYFSYWAAHPNGPEYSNSPAILQFVIEYNGKKENLGAPYTLPTDDNDWHLRSVTWKAPQDATSVTIGVYDLNNQAGTGNDFCLDDIMFQKLSYSESKVAFRDSYEVTFKNCDCDGPQVYRKWDDILLVSDPDGLYSGYQWFANGAAISGATQQYYRITDMSATYHCLLTLTDGSQVETCPTTFDAAVASASIWRPESSKKMVVATSTYVVSDHFSVRLTYYDDGTVDAEKQIR